MKFKDHIVSPVLVLLLTVPLHAGTSASHHQSKGGAGELPEVLTNISINLTGVSTVDIYCAATKKSWPSPPRAVGALKVNMPPKTTLFIAGDGAPKTANQWIQDPKPLPAKPTVVTYTCSNGRAVPAGSYGFTMSAKWSPQPKECWGTPPFTANVTGGIVVWNADGMGGTIFVPKLKSTTARIAPDDKDASDKRKWRKEIGVGEKVDLDILFHPDPVVVNWQASGDADSFDEALHGDHNRFRATKPAGAGGSVAINANVTSDWGDVALTKDFSVVKPSSIKTRRYAKNTYPVGAVAAGMHLYIQFGPTNVSFSDAYFREKGGLGTFDGAPRGRTGFYSYQRPPDHVPTVGWVSPDANNEVSDEAALEVGGWPPPSNISKSGSFYWHIPWVWEFDPIEDGDLIDPVDQTFDLTATGTVTVKKRDAQVVRAVNETNGN